MYIGGSIDSTVQKAVAQMEKLSEEKLEVGIMASGYPRSNDKLEQHLKTMLEESGKSVKIIGLE